ncbi:hypothetical protein K458DRAFT_399638 [Lentithecium fluviatile CBS 122367]|uniref:Uncharacterized protein n=1 Tax=Lentithecium fluviatile CBS 122367 TaxID=1168545 RepID=A0A6G1JJ90_9PLEO|nr:hypothetical protein K458DRAFT_399638 [Lentithecium fluviatile CBS 122367]
MNSSTRLYERLGQIPQDPEDPESMDDLVVYGYDLQPALQQWLWPTDGTQRDFASLQVVFGRGDEYFASDKNGKLEYKEPEVKPPPPEDLEEKPVLRRARTSVSFFRPLPSATKQQVPPPLESPPSSRRSSAASRESSSRPPSMSFSSRTMSDASLNSLSLSESAYSTTTTIPSRPTSDADIKPIDPVRVEADNGPRTASPTSAPTRSTSTRKLRPLSMSLKSGSFPRISEGTRLQFPDVTPPPPVPSLPLPTPPISTPSRPRRTSSPARQRTPQPFYTQQASEHCTCGYHPPPAPPRPAYADASVQTSPLPSPPRTALRLDTTPSTISNANFNSFPQSYQSYSSASSSALDIQTPQDVYYEEPASNGPFFMGRMMDYFSKPGYQLGDSLANSYAYSQQVYEYEELRRWEEANGRG